MSAGALPVISAAFGAVSTIQQMRAQKKQSKFNRLQVEKQNEADAIRNRYNQLQQKRQRLGEIRQARIRQGQIEGDTAGSQLGAGGTSSFSGSVGSIGTQVSANLGNISVAQDVGNQITGLNTMSANYGSQANTAASTANMWESASVLGDTIGTMGNLFGTTEKKKSQSLNFPAY